MTSWALAQNGPLEGGAGTSAAGNSTGNVQVGAPTSGATPGGPAIGPGTNAPGINGGTISPGINPPGINPPAVNGPIASPNQPAVRVPLQDPNAAVSPTPASGNPSVGGDISVQRTPQVLPPGEGPLAAPAGPSALPNPSGSDSLPPLPPPNSATATTQSPPNADGTRISPNNFGHLGITVVPVGNDDGLEVVGIERTSPAFPAGLLIGDQITFINGHRISQFEDLAKGLRAAGDGDGNVSLLVRRRGTIDTINVMVGGKKALLDRPKLGVTLDDSNGRLRVIGVAPKGPAAVAGVEPGDEIVTVNDYPVSTYDLFVGQIQALGRAGGQVPLGIRRNGKMITLRATLGDGKAPPLPPGELPPAGPDDIK